MSIYDPSLNPEWEPRVSRVASSSESMTLVFFWGIPSMILVSAYTYLIYGKVLPALMVLAPPLAPQPAGGHPFRN